MATLAYVRPFEAARAPALLRPSALGDRDRVRTFLTRLSPATAYARFFTGLGHPPEAMVRLLVDPAPGRGAWLATLPSSTDSQPDCGDVVVGHASWVFGGHDDAEISVVVADESQGLGIGHDLIGTVLGELRRTSAGILRLDVLASNRRVIGMITRRWPGWPPERDGTQLTYRVPLA